MAECLIKWGPHHDACELATICEDCFDDFLKWEKEGNLRMKPLSVNDIVDEIKLRVREPFGRPNQGQQDSVTLLNLLYWINQRLEQDAAFNEDDE